MTTRALTASVTGTSEGATTTASEVERNLALLKKLSSNPECLGPIVRALLAHVPTLVHFYGRNQETNLYICLSSLLHHVLKVRSRWVGSRCWSSSA